MRVPIWLSSSRPTVSSGPLGVRTLAMRRGCQPFLPEHVADDRDLLDHALVHVALDHIRALAAQAQQPAREELRAARGALPDRQAGLMLDSLLAHDTRSRMAAAAVPP